MKRLLTWSMVFSVLLGFPLAFMSSLVFAGIGYMDHTATNFLLLWGTEAMTIFALISGVGAVYIVITGE